MSGTTDTKLANEGALPVDLESLALRMAINNHILIERESDSPYLEGRRNAFLLMAVAIETQDEPALSRTVTQLRYALDGGVTEVEELRDIVTRSTGRSPTATPTLEWVGPKAFNARHGDRGLDEDFGMRWGAKHDVRISFRRPPGATEGLLYAYDKTWDTYAVLAVTTSRTLLQRSYRRALATDPEMTAEDFARHHHTVTAAARTSALARTVSL